MAYGRNAFIKCRRVTYTAWRDNHTSPSLHGFHIWSDDVMLCAKRNVYDRGGETDKRHWDDAVVTWCRHSLHVLSLVTEVYLVTAVVVCRIHAYMTTQRQSEEASAAFSVS